MGYARELALDTTFWLAQPRAQIKQSVLHCPLHMFVLNTMKEGTRIQKLEIQGRGGVRKP